MTCKHLTVIRWMFEDGKPADLWACIDCKHRFEPLKIAQQDRPDTRDAGPFAFGGRKTRRDP